MSVPRTALGAQWDRGAQLCQLTPSRTERAGPALRSWRWTWGSNCSPLGGGRAAGDVIWPQGQVGGACRSPRRRPRESLRRYTRLGPSLLGEGLQSLLESKRRTGILGETPRPCTEPKAGLVYLGEGRTQTDKRQNQTTPAKAQDWEKSW